MIQFGGNNEEITKNCPNAPFLLSLEDDPDGRLRIVIALPQRGEEGEGVDELKKISCLENKDIQNMLAKSYPVFEDMNNVYEIIFESYIIYQCRNESYTAYDNTEQRKGNYLIEFEKSNLFEYYQNIIFDFDSDETKARRKHYGIYTENHIIDVISNEVPTIRRPEI